MAALVLLAWLAPLVAPHAAGDDPFCAPLASGDESASLRAAADDPHQPSDHCVICHTARSHRTALSNLGSCPVALVAGLELAPVAAGWHRTPALDSLPARAPPA
jgi:hypothetical protein